MTQPSQPAAYPAELPPVPDLPPVEAPSAGFIVQLFVIPAVVVLVVVCVWLLFGKLAGGERDAMEYVRLIRNSSGNLRAANRAAFELASLIQNDPKLASDPRLLGELTDVLEHDLDHIENVEVTQYVALALGRFQTLDATASTGQKIDPVSALDRALEAKQPAVIRIAAAASLAQHAARLKGKFDDSRAVAALAQAAVGGPAELSEVAVYALGFCAGEEAAKALRDQLNAGERFVRYNAAIALARRGDPAAAPILGEMLSPADLDKLITIDAPGEKRVKIEAIELEALHALQTSVADAHPALAQSLLPAIDAETRSGVVGIRNSARALANSLDRPK